MKTMMTLVRREFWEHRALWLAPLGMALLLVGVAIVGNFHIGDHLTALTGEQALALMSVTISATNIAILLIASIVLSFYVLDCLYAERRDRSILFWKSLPVSDAATVLSKLLVALIIVPLGCFALSLLTDLLLRGILSLRSVGTTASGSFPLWDAGTWFKTQSLLFIGLLVSILWYAPLAAYLLLASAWARRNVFLWAFLPPVVIVILEKIALGTDRVLDFIGGRLELGADIGDRSIASATIEIDKSSSVVSLTRIFDELDLAAQFFNAPMMLGLVAAALMVFATIRIRRFRDDT